MIELEAWIKEYLVPEEMLWKGSAESQFDYWKLVLAWFRWWDEGATADVVSTHCSKSIELPVVRFHSPRFGLTLFGRGNFYDWGFTVQCDTPPWEFDHAGLKFDENAVYYEGFSSGGIPVHTHSPKPGTTTEFSFKLLSGLEPLEALPRIVRAARH
jgi:hypothetical protein